jgi:hypothetical protein
MYEITKMSRLCHILCQNHIFVLYLRVFLSFNILATALNHLRDPRKIFSTNNLRLVKKDSAVRKSQLLVKCMKSQYRVD